MNFANNKDKIYILSRYFGDFTKTCFTNNKYCDYNEKNINNILNENNISLKEIAQPLRYILTGRFASPGLYVLIELLGKNLVKKRL